MRPLFAPRSISFQAISTRCRRWFPRSNKAEYPCTNLLAREKRSSASRVWFTSIVTRSIGSHRPRSISAWSCSKGFYVRTYAHDIGDTLGCGAHLKNLRRTKSGRFKVDGAITVEELQNSDPAEITRRILTLPEVSRMRGA